LLKEEDTMFKLKRAYERASREDGQRILVERLWPRGVRKASLQLDAWLKEVAPTTVLRQWFSHDPKKWDEFRQRYRAELERHPEVCDPILKAVRRGTVTLVYSSHDREHNNAVALRDYLETRLGRKHRSAEHKSAA
jgi:uncharacterized protein YeaO (DUF488 family)